MRKPPPPLEAEILAGCLKAFELLRVSAWRRNVGMTVATYQGRKRIIRSGTPGQSDIWFLLPDGRHGECEVKRPGKKPTVEQLLWLREVNLLTGAAFWV